MRSFSCHSIPKLPLASSPCASRAIHRSAGLLLPRRSAGRSLCVELNVALLQLLHHHLDALVHLEVTKADRGNGQRSRRGGCPTMPGRQTQGRVTHGENDGLAGRDSENSRGDALVCSIREVMREGVSQSSDEAKATRVCRRQAERRSARNNTYRTLSDPPLGTYPRRPWSLD